MESSLGNGFTGIDILHGSSYSDSFRGINENATFELSAANRYIISAFSLKFVSLENLTGGNQSDTFIINEAISLTLNGGDGDDSFIFRDSGKLTGGIDGGQGSNTINFSDYKTGQKVVLTAIGTDGFNGTLALVSGGFQDISCLVGGESGDTLTGINSDAIFDLANGTYTSGSILSFTGFDTLMGGSGNDIFIFTAQGNFTGTVDGGKGSDTIDYRNYQADVMVNLATGSATGINEGAVKSIFNMENVYGAKDYQNTITGNDGDNILTGGSKDDILSGGKGNDTYVFMDNWGNNDTILENANQGNDTLDLSGVTVELIFTFDGNSALVSDTLGNRITDDNQMENFIGGLEDDSFIFKNGAVIKGKVDGNEGQNTLDFREYTTGRNFILTGLGTKVGFSGREAALSSFNKIPYDQTKITAGEQPVMYYFDPVQNKWVSIETVLEYDETTDQWYAVSKVNHLTLFAVFSTRILTASLTIGEIKANIDDGREYLLETAPYIDKEAGRTLVPVRFISEMMGAKVDWVASSRQVVIIKDSIKIVFTLGSREVLVNSEKRMLDSAPQLLSTGRTFVPLRFVSETLGAKVNYISSTGEISVIFLAPLIQ